MWKRLAAQMKEFFPRVTGVARAVKNRLFV
jgi:hypothetical protein